MERLLMPVPLLVSLGKTFHRAVARSAKNLVQYIAIVFSLEWLPGTQVYFFHLVSEYTRHSIR